MNQKVMQNNFKKEHKVDQRSKNISMKQNNGSLKKARKFQVKNKGNRIPFGENELHPKS